MMSNDIYKFIIEGFTPETLPLARQTVYLGLLAKLLGSSNHVHFRGIEAGSAIIRLEVEPEYKDEVAKNILKATLPESSNHKYYNRINQELADDHTNGSLIVESQSLSSTNDFDRLVFDGIVKNHDGKSEFFPKIKGQLQGFIRGMDKDKNRDLVWITLETAQTTHRQLYCDLNLAQEIAKDYLTDPIRIYGIGDWTRSHDGNWQIKSFKIEKFEVLVDRPVTETFAELQKIYGTPWKDIDDPLKVIMDNRYGEGNY